MIEKIPVTNSWMLQNNLQGRKMKAEMFEQNFHI